MFRFILVILVFSGIGVNIRAQSNTASKQRKKDSLLAIIGKNERDTNHVKALLEYLRSAREKSPDTSMRFANDAVNICIKNNYPKFLPRAYNSLAVSYIRKGLVDTALVIYDTAIAAAVRADDYKVASLAATSAGYQYYQMVDYSKALEYYLTGYDYALKADDKFSIMNSLNSISSVYFAMRNYDMAMDYTRKMLAEAKSRNDQSTMANAYGNLGAVQAKSGNLDSAIYFTGKCIDLFVSMGLKAGYANYYLNGANYLFDAGRYDEAEEMAMKGYVMSTSGMDIGSYSRALTTLGKIDMVRNRPDSALIHATRAYEAAEQSNSVNQMLSAMEVMAHAYLSLGKPEQARELYERVIRLQDSVYDEDNARVLSEMQVRFDKRRDKEEIDMLSKENEIKNEKIRQGNILMIAGAVATALILIVLVLVYRGYKLKKRSAQVLADRNKLISHQRDEIGIRNKEITDSINYAKRIQEAILPSIADFVQAAGDAFVFFRPKDIVSGDFYWYSKHNSLFFFAAGDCTGHGVPGGFMSVLGMERLADFAAASSSPGEVLGMLNLAIKRSLHQESDLSETRDGMDIALCALDRTKGKLHYSGANRPLWIVRDGKLLETAPTKAAIGGLTPDDQAFTSHIVDVHDGDMIFLSTDGYADQFGGDTNKKFMTRNFKKLLVASSGKPVREQESEINAQFTKWKGSNEQVDDVLVIGISVRS